jgi:hypothetical protein
MVTLSGMTIAFLLALPPRIGYVTPSDGAKDIPTDAVISVHVDGTDVRPSVTLVELPHETLVEGRVERTSHWSHAPATPPSHPPGHIEEYREEGNYVFTPAKPLKPKTRYEIRAVGLKAVFTTGAGPARPKSAERKPK